MADGERVTLTLDLLPMGIRAPAAAIPSQLAAPAIVVSLTAGCDAPLEALKIAPADHEIRCHPCDEAVVRLLISRAQRSDALLISESVSPGTLRLG